MLFSLERFDQPVYLWLALVVVLMWWFSRHSLAGLGPARSRVSMATRALVVVLLVLAMAGTHKILKSEDLCVMFVVDESRSVPSDARRQAEQFIARVCQEMRPDDRAAVLTFDGLTDIKQLPSRPGPEGGLHVGVPFGDGQSPDSTNIGQALRMAEACALDSTNNRVVVLSDGNQNVGDAAEEAKTAAANKITVDVVPLRYQRGPEIVNEQLRVPAYANLHDQVFLRLIFRSDQETSGTVYVYQRVGQEEELVDLDSASDRQGIRETLHPGRNVFTVSLPIKVARTHEFRSEFVPDDASADVIRENNVARAFTNIEGPQRVLVIGTKDDVPDNEMLVDALRKEDIDVQYEPAESVNLEPAAIQDFSAILLSNVPADYVSAAQQQALATYVRDMGGGLLMLGGDASFGAGGWQGSVVEDIMPVRFDVDEIKQIPRGALAIVMHSCEMPQGNTWGIEVAVAALKTLSRLDYFGVVGYTMTGVDWEVKMQLATNKDAIIGKIRNMQNGDMPDYDTSMELAYQGLMSCRDAKQRHMIIISDGDASGPAPGLVNKLVGQGITCSTVTVFPHGGGDAIKWIADATKGRSYLLCQPGDEKQLPRIFIKEARVVRRPLINEEPFKPRVLPNISDIMLGISEAEIPQSGGYVVTTPRKVVDVEMPLVSQKGDPLLAHWRCGFGRTVAFTSGWWKHWGKEWTPWEGFSKLWAQAVRWAMQQGTAADYDVTTTIEGDEGHVVIESAGSEEGTIAASGFVAKVIKPDGTAAELQVAQTGPGRYEARFPARHTGTYLVNLRSLNPEDEKPVMIRTGVTLAYSPEYKDLATNEGLLQTVADEAKGRMLSLQADSKAVFAHNLPPTITRTPIWDLLLKIAVFVFLFDVAVRRVAVDPLKAGAAARRYVASWAEHLGVGKRAEATLTDLKTVRAKVRAEKTAAGDAGAALSDAAPPGVDAGEAAPVSTTKFVAERRLKKKPAADLSQALGGPTAPAEKPAVPQTGPPKPEESTTARLLKAKKRAQQGREEERKE